MRWHLLRRCLLFGTLGLITSVAVAWGLSVRWQATQPVSRPASQMPQRAAYGLAVRDGVMISITVWRGFGWRIQTSSFHDTKLESSRQHALRKQAERVAAIGGEAYDREVAERSQPLLVAPRQRIDEQTGRAALPSDLANRGTYIADMRFGWPATAIGASVRTDQHERDDPTVMETSGTVVEESTRDMIELPWGPSSGNAAGDRPLYLPLRPHPGLLLSTIFYAALWAGLLLGPGAARRRLRARRGRCPACGYDLTGAPAPGGGGGGVCPECGAGRRNVAPTPQAEGFDRK